MVHPAIRDLLLSAARHPAFQELLHRIRRCDAAAGARLGALCGLTQTAKALYLVLLWQALRRPLLAIVEDPRRAEELAQVAATFFEMLSDERTFAAPQLLPAFDVWPGHGLAPHAEIRQQRAVALWRLATARSSVTFAPVAAALTRLHPPEFYRHLALWLHVGDETSFEDLVAHLENTGYQRRDPVEMIGEYSVRGGILDVFPAESERPVRIEFLGDRIESMRRFDVESQRSVVRTDRCLILPMTEQPASAELHEELARRLGAGKGEIPGWELLAPLVQPRTASLVEQAENPVIVLDEPSALEAAAERIWDRLEQDPRTAPLHPERFFLRWRELLERAGTAATVALHELALAGDPGALEIVTRPALSFQGNVRIAVAEARNLIETGHRVVFFAAATGELERTAEIFNEYGLAFQFAAAPGESLPPYLAERAGLGGAAGALLARGALRRGAILPQSALAIFGAEDLFGAPGWALRPPRARPSTRAFAADVADLAIGDYVVHQEHGIGRFLGLRRIEQGDQQGEYMMLEYAGGARLYVPLTRLDLISKYRGAGEQAPALDRLGGATWERTKRRVKARMRDMAEELLKLYAERKLAGGFAFSPDSDWQREFEEAFEFEETEDQLTALREIKRDMESPQPMDRLLCGDVGFGKTEVAMRAAFKALGDGKQVAVLAPTTVLVFQHYETFKRRFAPFPVRVEMLSRFRNRREIELVLKDTAEGKVDILIGTHRLLSDDVRFRDLGLLIIDEEQRFGVRHKEKLKHLKKNVDVLTMTATPIPRTLHMSLVGLRDLSVIETPPKDRLAIHTIVAHFDPELIRTAIEQELARGGQVYFVHNRVETIWERAALIQQLAPSARVAVAHGQMGEAALERVMLGFMQHAYDVLVCTTIVENGLDIPAANTIIIDHAERYGLAELYQLRGRVGRSNRRAYAYLLVPPESELSELARKRLAALKEFSELGAGFKIAALDLELRGAGNLLGGEQHGHINAVGYDMYVRMLEETIRELRGEQARPEIRTALNLGLDLRIPPDYIADERQRLRAYKRIAEADTPGAVEQVQAELVDRYGPLPESVRWLLEYSLLKAMAQKLGIEAIERAQGRLRVRFHRDSPVDPARLAELVRRLPGAQFTPAGLLLLPTDGAREPAGLLELLKRHLAWLLASPATQPALHDPDRA
ncbi:MAG: transcription-repair coupling factor [Bryobacterales bacterium]|nr:transcription-repair coupling factor [Bryobacterales bacterium]